MRTNKLVHVLLAPILLAILSMILDVTAKSIQTPPPSKAMQEADTLFQAQKWTEAARAYEAITKEAPGNGRAWLRLGISFHRSFGYEKAIEAYQKALDKVQPQGKTIAMYNLAAAYAKLNDKEKAIEWLTRLAAAGLGAAAGQLKSDEDFASLREDSRFKEVLLTADKLTRPCMYSAKSRELDFWVGEWDVTINGQKVGSSSVKPIEDGCVILEAWSGGGGQTGKSMNFYNPVSAKWRQTYVGNTLGIWEMSGEYRDGAMRFEGELYTAPASKVITRMTFFNLGPDKVRQLGENSADEGKTWTSVWDAIYTRTSLRK